MSRSRPLLTPKKNGTLIHPLYFGKSHKSNVNGVSLKKKKNQLLSNIC